MLVPLYFPTTINLGKLCTYMEGSMMVCIHGVYLMLEQVCWFDLHCTSYVDCCQLV